MNNTLLRHGLHNLFRPGGFEYHQESTCTIPDLGVLACSIPDSSVGSARTPRSRMVLVYMGVYKIGRRPREDPVGAGGAGKDTLHR